MPGPLLLDLVAALVQGGAPPQAALRAVAAGLREDGDDQADGFLLVADRVGHPRRGEGAGDGIATVIEEAMWLAVRAGLPPTALIRRAAAEERRRRAAIRTRAVRRLEVLLVLPTGLCLLPAFVLLGVVPVVLDLLRG